MENFEIFWTYKDTRKSSAAFGEEKAAQSFHAEMSCTRLCLIVFASILLMTTQQMARGLFTSLLVYQLIKSLRSVLMDSVTARINTSSRLK